MRDVDALNRDRGVRSIQAVSILSRGGAIVVAFDDDPHWRMEMAVDVVRKSGGYEAKETQSTR